jgi:hypothetical protein
MITGAHLLLYSANPEADRAFFRDVLRFPSVDAGEGWLIFRLPPSEVALHPMEGERRVLHAGHHLQSGVLYLMCSDVRSQVESLSARGVSAGEIVEAPWGITTTIRLPSGGEIGLYQPTHPTALNLER